MLKERILLTLRFFDLQDYPLTLLELRQFLIADREVLAGQTDGQGEININQTDEFMQPRVSAAEILECLDTECQGQVENTKGFYHLSGRKNIVKDRLNNYLFGFGREKLIRKFTGALKYLPFVRGAALAGSQALGQQKESSDIDLLIITEARFLWLARTLITAYFQILGLRRHGRFVANRFCLNHYLAGPKNIGQFRNLYTAHEYLKLRPLVNPRAVWQFQQNNIGWLKVFFPEAEILEPEQDRQPKVQRYLENLLNGKFGLLLEKLFKNWQLPKIRKEKFIVVEEDELSFHPESKQQQLLLKFFKFQEQ